MLNGKTADFALITTPFDLLDNMEAATSDQILPLVESNLGIGFVPQAFLKNVENVVPLKIDIPEREIKLVKRKDVPLSLAAKTLSAALVDSKRDDA